MRLRPALIGSLLLVPSMLACGGESDLPAVQPAEDDPIFVSGDFGEIPVHPLAEEAGAKNHENDVVAQSFIVRNMSRDLLFSWYADRLEGWTQEESPRPLGDAANASWRGLWTRADRRLIITVSAAPESATEGGTGPDVVLQYSLSLEPIDRPVPGTG